jgi:hypothetical protein
MKYGCLGLPIFRCRIVGRTECKCNLMEFDGLLQTRRDAMLPLESRMKDTRKCCESIRMARDRIQGQLQRESLTSSR